MNKKILAIWIISSLTLLSCTQNNSENTVNNSWATEHRK